MDLWIRLVLEKRFDLIKKLHRVELKEPGYGTIVVTKEGFSDNDQTHNMVLKFLNKNKVNIMNPGLEEARLKYLLGRKYDISE